jgi:hypothetical protein
MLQIFHQDKNDWQDRSFSKEPGIYEVHASYGTRVVNVHDLDMVM